MKETHFSTKDIVFQWKPWPDECESSKAPSAFLTTRPSGTWRLRINSDSGRDFVFRFKWSHGSDGATEIWHQTHKNPGWQKVTSTGPTDVTSRTIFHDNIAIGTSFNAVDPSMIR